MLQLLATEMQKKLFLSITNTKVIRSLTTSTSTFVSCRNFQTLHPIFEMLSYGSMHRYASSCLATNEFTGLNLTCR